MDGPQDPKGLRALAATHWSNADQMEKRADAIALSGLEIARQGDEYRAEAHWFQCRRLRVRALFERAYAYAALEALGRTR